MSDVLDIARAKCAKLKAETACLEAFIRLGEKMARDAEADEAPEKSAQTVSRDALADRLGSMRATAAE